jgi:hypothetical protein
MRGRGGRLWGLISHEEHTEPPEALSMGPRLSLARDTARIEKEEEIYGGRGK